MSKKISVKSHVSRDFLQNAVYFNTLPKVVWEYVSNSLDNGKEDIPTTIAVEIRKEEDIIIVADNGAGMSREDLGRFFYYAWGKHSEEAREARPWKIWNG